MTESSLGCVGRSHASPVHRGFSGLARPAPVKEMKRGRQVARESTGFLSGFHDPRGDAGFPAE